MLTKLQRKAKLVEVLFLQPSLYGSYRSTKLVSRGFFYNFLEKTNAVILTSMYKLLSHDQKIALFNDKVYLDSNIDDITMAIVEMGDLVLQVPGSQTVAFEAIKKSVVEAELEKCNIKCKIVGSKVSWKAFGSYVIPVIIGYKDGQKIQANINLKLTRKI
jgi:hypothetical protein